jgi:O-Antigen ligase
VTAPGCGARCAAFAAHLVVPAFVLTLGAAAFVFDPSGRDLDRYHLFKEAVLALGALSCLGLTLLSRRGLGFDALDGAWMALVACEFVPLLAALDRDAALRAAGITLSGAALALAWRAQPSEVRMRVGALAFGLAGVCACVLIFEGYSGRRVSLVGMGPGGTLGNRNQAGQLLAIAGVGLFGYGFGSRATVEGNASAGGGAGLNSGRSRSDAAAQLIALLLISWAVVLTRSRVAWLAALVGLSLVGLSAIGSIFLEQVQRVRAQRSEAQRSQQTLGLRSTALLRWAAPRVLAVLVGSAAAVWLPSRLHWRSDAPYQQSLSRLLSVEEGSGAGRLMQWRASVPLLAEAPLFGVGPAQWAYHYPRLAPAKDPTLQRDAWGPTARLVSNDGFSWLIERGSMGLAGLLVVVGMTLRATLCSPVTQRLPLLAALAALSVAATLDVVLRLALGMLALVLMLPARATERYPRWGLLTGIACALAVSLTLPRALQRAWLHHERRDADVLTIERLAREAPWNTKLQQDLTEWYLSRGECEHALPYLTELTKRRPFTPRVQSAWRECGLSAPR